MATHGSRRDEPVADLSMSEAAVILCEIDNSGRITEVGPLRDGDGELSDAELAEMIQFDADFDEGLEDFDVAMQHMEDGSGVNIGEPSIIAEKEMESALRLEEEAKENEAFIEEQLTKSTQKKTKQTAGQFQSWLLSKHEDRRPMETIPPTELDILLGSFLMTATIEKGRRAGEAYEPESLTSMHRALDRHLRSKGYKTSILKDTTFNTSRAVLAAKKKSLKKQGKGNLPNRAEPISDEAFDILWKKGFLGSHSPTSLIHTVFVNLVMGFGMRPNHGSYQLKWGDVQLKNEEQKDGSILRYIEWNERLTKTRAGQLEDGVRAFSPKIYEVKSERCPVKMYERYAARRPRACMEADDPFYLGINHHASVDSPVWYIKCPMGINTIIPIMSQMATKAGLQGRITNHSLRKSMVTTLLQQNVPPNMIMQVSGHKAIESVNSYAVASRTQQKAMSNIICGAARPAEQVVASHTELPPARNNPNLDTISAIELNELEDVEEPCPSTSTDVSAPKTATSTIVRRPGKTTMLAKTKQDVMEVTHHSEYEESLLKRIHELEGRVKHGEKSDQERSVDGLLRGVLAGANVTGNVSISVNVTQAHNTPHVSLSPIVPDRPAVTE